ncbi:MAG: HAMP domain-containing sensor histidine kinase [Parasphingorhabdus sp.]|nr:HAMP domain-containing sensor histidine kinase [Parasphingorhabdus sp.]
MLRPLINLFGSTTARFIFLLFGVQIVALSAMLYIVRIQNERALMADQLELVRNMRDDLLTYHTQGGSQLLRLGIFDLLRRNGNADAVVLLLGADGRRRAGNLTEWPKNVPRNSPWLILELYPNGSGRSVPVGVITTALPDGAELLTGRIVTSSLRLTAINQKATIAAFLLAIPLSLLVALLLGRIINERVSGIARTVNNVRRGDLTQRIRLDGSGDAFDRLGSNVNAMLERIDALISEMRMVTDGLAHDLRSPVTRMKSVIERAIIETDDETALVALQKASSEAETLLTMLSTALQISRAEAGIGRDHFVETEIATLLADLVEVYGPLAEDHGFALAHEAAAGLHIKLNRSLVSQALGNLIENSLKYATGGDKISLIAKVAEGGVAVSVADNGAGIAAEQREDARRRFGRLDPSRNISGSGLGMSLVEAVAKLHGGTLILSDNHPGLIVTITLIDDGEVKNGDKTKKPAS